MKNVNEAKKEFSNSSNKLIYITIEMTKRKTIIWNNFSNFPDDFDPGAKIHSFIQRQLSKGLAIIPNDSFFGVSGEILFFCLTFIKLEDGKKTIIVASSNPNEKIFVDLDPSETELPLRLYNLIRFSITETDDEDGNKLDALKSVYDALSEG